LADGVPTEAMASENVLFVLWLLIVGCLIWSPVILGATRPSAVVPFVFLQQYLMLLGSFCIDVNFGKTLVNKRIADKKIIFFI